MEEEYLSTNSGCMPKVTNSCQQIISLLKFKNPVYPLDPVAPENSEFFLINSEIRLRIIHVKPDIQRVKRQSLEISSNSKRNSLSEEYWFTKWNRPLKIGNCSCSFRRSFRFSIASNKSGTLKLEENLETLNNLDKIPKRIVNVETFVERILQETLFEAFQECYMLQCKNNKNHGNINRAYEHSEEDDIVLRTKNVTNFITQEPKNNETERINRLSRHCIHKKRFNKKPLIILIHGIGNSADIWWPIMNSLVNKGFEVVAPDMLGHGYSSAPNKSNLYTFNNLLLHFITIFDHYVGSEESQKCILIGHSYGCSIISALYRHRASQITQLILISGGGPTPLAAPVTNNEISPFGCVHMFFKPLLLCGLKRSFLFSSRGKHFDVCDTETAIPSQILEYIRKGQNWPEGDAAFHRRILVPTLLVHGLQDKQITLVQQCEMERTIPRAFLELIPNAGHMAMLETPEHLSHMILCFIDTWS